MPAVKFVEFEWNHFNSKPEVIEYNLLDMIQKEKNIHDADVVLIDYYKDNCTACVMLGKALESIGPRLSINLTVIKVKMETVGTHFFQSVGLRTVPVLEHRALPGFTQQVSGYSTPNHLLEWIESLT